MADVLATEQIRPLYDTDKPAFVLTVADLREQRATAASPGPWTNKGYAAGTPVPHVVDFGPIPRRADTPYAVCYGDLITADAEHIAAEANPAHALAAVRRWRGVVERHTLWDKMHQSARAADTRGCAPT